MKEAVRGTVTGSDCPSRAATAAGLARLAWAELASRFLQRVVAHRVLESRVCQVEKLDHATVRNFLTVPVSVSRS